MTDTPQFRIGDRVRVRRTDKTATGISLGCRAGVVTETAIVGGMAQVAVKLNAGNRWWYAASEIEHDTTDETK